MRSILCVLVLCFLTACGHRGIPPEITILHTLPKKTLPKLKREMIIVDAGHGGKDAGASSKKEGYEEKELTLETAFLIVDSLKQMGYKTVLTRKQDTYVPLEARAEIANSVDADLFVSIHYNYSVSKEAEGIEVFYYKEGKTPLSQRVTQSKVLGQEVLKTIVKQTGAESRGVKQANFAVVRETKMPAILIEAGFLSNPAERARIHDHKYRRSLAQGIAQGIDAYLTQSRK
ncbi:N-acetylmuramoyl-L-alanine amidase [Chlamydiota bacterium]